MSSELNSMIIVAFRGLPRSSTSIEGSYEVFFTWVATIVNVALLWMPCTVANGTYVIGHIYCMCLHYD